MPKAHPPNSSVWFPSASHFMLFLFVLCHAMTYYFKLAILAQVDQGCRAPIEKGVQSSQHAVVATTLLTLHHTTTTLTS